MCCADTGYADSLTHGVTLSSHGFEVMERIMGRPHMTIRMVHCAQISSLQTRLWTTSGCHMTHATWAEVWRTREPFNARSVVPTVSTCSL